MVFLRGVIFLERGGILRQVWFSKRGVVFLERGGILREGCHSKRLRDGILRDRWYY